MNNTVNWVYGIDADVDVTNHVVGLKAAKKVFAGRYYGPKTYPLTKAEADACHAKGIYVVSVYEGAADHYNYFSAEQGKADGEHALAQATAAGQPTGGVIYNAIDFDPDLAQLTSNIAEYIKAFVAALSGHYAVGIYGSGLSCRILSLHIPSLSHFWLACSSGWAEYEEFGRSERANIIQYSCDGHVAGLDCDLNKGVHNQTGAW